MSYDPRHIEPKWQRHWEENRTFSADINAGGPKCYVLDMFPYPSGTSMHVGHPRGYVATDVYSRFKRMTGHQVLHPMGWDSFGLPAEETAIARQEYPSLTVDRNIAQFKGQLQRLGLSYDWTREIKTTDPLFYRHTQRLFLEFFRRGLAYNATSQVNWCPALGTVLANEDIVDGVSERGGHPVELIPLRQWMLRITAYADRLIDGLERLPAWPDKIKNSQREWIGRSAGHLVDFGIRSMDAEIARAPVFTTRIETIGGATFLALAPGSDLATALIEAAGNREDAAAYVHSTKARTDRDRQTSAAKTGIVLQGLAASNPVTGAPVPVVIADYVLEGYGTGAIMGVPAHDARDAEMALTLGLQSVVSVGEDGKLTNSGPFDELSVAEGRTAIAAQTGAEPKVQFKMRDWVFSRQRFWGEPFPMLWIEGSQAYEACKAGAMGEWLPEQPVSYSADGRIFFAVPVIPEQLHAAALPVVDSYRPTGSMEGPLAGLHNWVNVWLEPRSGAIHGTAGPGRVPARRETNTMPQWAGSSWYWLRFMDPHNAEEPFSADAAKKWGPVDLYAGADHAVAHLIYARFWQKVLFDAGLVGHDEPFTRLEFLGYVLASDGSKISKRRNNSRNPDEVIANVGADAFRLYEMAIGPFEKAVPWNDDGLNGQARFLRRTFAQCQKVVEADATTSGAGVDFLINRCIGSVTRDIEAFKFNTAVSALMIFIKESEGAAVSRRDYSLFIRLLAPFAPHVAEEMWQEIGEIGSVHHSAWPIADPSALRRNTVTVPVQINGKRRGELQLEVGTTEDVARATALADPHVAKWLTGQQLNKFIFVEDRIINIVASPVEGDT